MKNKIIELKGVYVYYQDLLALENVNLEISEGEFHSIIGPNGAGKTTLLKLIIGLIKPTKGTIKVFGKNPWKLGKERKKIGYVPQIMSVDINFPVNVMEVVLMGRYAQIGLFKPPGKIDKELALKAMEKVGIADLYSRSLSKLSGGQRQRVFLARALSNEPEILILDEPTTGVDTATTESFYELLQDLRKDGMTIVIVSHDIGVVAAYVDRIACLNKKLVAHGRPEEVLKEPKLEEMYGCEAILLLHHNIPHIAVKEH
ncbi:hypothetical protein DRQ09_09750 [candidate division KSB1 bacterium]|nr:MAG: hypothetical protein DRQ09_09750 [candidate division KSB1 bacterium]